MAICNYFSPKTSLRQELVVSAACSSCSTWSQHSESYNKWIDAHLQTPSQVVKSFQKFGKLYSENSHRSMIYDHFHHLKGSWQRLQKQNGLNIICVMGLHVLFTTTWSRLWMLHFTRDVIVRVTHVTLSSINLRLCKDIHYQAKINLNFQIWVARWYSHSRSEYEEHVSKVYFMKSLSVPEEAKYVELQNSVLLWRH